MSYPRQLHPVQIFGPKPAAGVVDADFTAPKPVEEPTPADEAAIRAQELVVEEPAEAEVVVEEPAEIEPEVEAEKPATKRATPPK